MPIKRMAIHQNELSMYEELAKRLTADTGEHYGVALIASEGERYFPNGPGTEGKTVARGFVAVRVKYPHHRGIDKFNSELNLSRSKLPS